jgi:nickel-dependent lactate racemase
MTASDATPARRLDDLDLSPALPPNRDRLTVVVNDPQRQTATASVLRRIACHIPPGRTTLLVATGTHRFATATRDRFLAGLAEDRRYQGCLWHDALGRDLTTFASDDFAWAGHRRLLDRPVLAVGSVEPHYFAGFTGAHKTLTIGCASRVDVERNHAHALSSDARPCRMEGNPVFEGIARMYRALAPGRGLRAINLLQAGPEVLLASAGEAMASLGRLVEHVEARLVRWLDRPADAVVARVAGPLGDSFYQADKGIKNTQWGVRDGGVLVLEAPCGEGVGQDAFLSLLRRGPSHARALDQIGRAGYRLGDHKAVALRNLTDPARRGVHLQLVTPGLDEATAKLLGGTLAPDVETALARAGMDPDGSGVIRVEDAGNVVLRIGPQPAEA